MSRIVESLYSKYSLTENLNDSRDIINEIIRDWAWGNGIPESDKNLLTQNGYEIGPNANWIMDTETGEKILYRDAPDVPDDFDYVGYMLGEIPWDAVRSVRESKNRNTKSKNSSLIEARNPENDEVNAVIRKWANSDRNRLSKKDKEILDKNGLSLEDDAWMKGSKHIAGPATKDNKSRYMTKGNVKGVHPDYDLKGYLSKNPQSYDDTEVPIGGEDSPYVKANEDQPQAEYARHRRDAKQKMSHNQFKSLQPYADEKKAFRQNKEDSKDAYKRAKELQTRAKDKLKKAVDYYDDDMSYASRWENDAADYKKDAYRALQQAKEKHDAKKKNESLLKEDYSKEDILSYIETLINIWEEIYEDVRVGDYDIIEEKIDDIESNEYAVMRFLKSFIK